MGASASASTPDGATSWEAQEAGKVWRTALSDLDDALARLASIRQRFLDIDPNKPQPDLATAVNNAAGRLAAAAVTVGRWRGVCEGSLHRQAEDRHHREAQQAVVSEMVGSDLLARLDSITGVDDPTEVGAARDEAATALRTLMEGSI